MTVVKNISASENFLSLADTKKKCMDNVYEECKNKRLLRKLQENFGCTPFGLSLAAIKEWVSVFGLHFDLLYDLYTTM